MSFRDNAAQSRFEFDHDGGTSFGEYRDRDGVRVLTHIETPHELRGKGGAAKLMEQIVAWSRAGGAKLQPRCGYAIAWLQRHSDARDVLA